MKRHNFLLRLLLTLGLLAVLMPAAASAYGPYQVFFDYDDSLCDFAVYSNNEPVYSGDMVYVTNQDSYYDDDVVPLYFEITDIAEGYRIKEVRVDYNTYPFAIRGYYGQGSLEIRSDSTIHVVLEDIPADLPAISQIGIYTLINDIDPVLTDSVMFEYGVYERLQADILTSDWMMYPDFLYDYEWEFSTDGQNWTPLYSEERFEFYAPTAGMESGYEEGYFMDLQNYYLRVHVVGMERHINGDVYSAPIAVNHSDAAPTGYKLTVNYDPTLCSVSMYSFDGPYGDEILPDTLISPGSEVTVFLDSIQSGARIRDCLVNGNRYNPLSDTRYALDLMNGGQPSISFFMNSDTTVDLTLEPGGTLPCVQSATISADSSNIPLQTVTFAYDTMEWLDVDVIYENGVDAPAFFPVCHWEYSTDNGASWIEIDQYFNERFKASAYNPGFQFISEKDYLLRAKLIGRTNYCMTANGSYIYTDPILVNPSAPVVFFDTTGGKMPGTGISLVGPDRKLPALPTPENEGYLFDGWYTQPQGGVKITDETTFTRNTTIYAHWATAHPIPADPKVLPDFFHSCEVNIEQDGSVVSVVVGQKDPAQDLSTFTSWVAAYDNGRMTGLQQLTGTVSPDGTVTFTGTVNGAGDKLFLLSGDVIPIIEAPVSQ